MKIHKYLFLFSKKFYWSLLSGILLASLAALANFGLLFLSGWLLAGAACAGLSGIAAQRTFNMVLPATGVRFFATVRILTRYAERLVTHNSALQLISQIRVAFYKTIAPQAPAALNTQRGGNLLNQFVVDTDRMGQYYTDTLIPFARAALCGCFFIAIFAYFSLHAALCIAVSFAVSGFFIPFLTGLFSDKILYHASTLQNTFQSEVTDTLNCLGEYLTLGAAQKQKNYLAQQQASFLKLQLSLAGIESLAQAATRLCSTITTLAVLYYAAQELTQHTLSLPEVPMLVLGCLAACDVLNSLPAARQSLGTARLAMQRLTHAYTTLEPVEQQNHALTINQPLTLRLQDISFQYPHTQHWVFHHANLTIHHGERVAILGPSGSGKSSLISLLFGFYPYQQGQAFIGDATLKNVQAEALAAYIAVAGQDFHLFNGTVRDNLLLANSFATEQDIWAALNTVQLSDFIKSMPNRLETLVGNEGLSLSGGQAKRLSIAQALLRNTPWLILDEPTEGLDAHTEQALLENLIRFRPDATIVCLTHRAAVLPFMTRILQIKEGAFSPIKEG